MLHPRRPLQRASNLEPARAADYRSLSLSIDDIVDLSIVIYREKVEISSIRFDNLRSFFGIASTQTMIFAIILRKSTSRWLTQKHDTYALYRWNSSMTSMSVFIDDSSMLSINDRSMKKGTSLRAIQSTTLDKSPVDPTFQSPVLDGHLKM
jgi:hypothetical protein